MNKIVPFDNIPYVDPSQRADEVAVLASQMGGQQQTGNFLFLQVGSGATSFKVDPDGMWLGAEVMADAPYSADMLGNVILNSVLISGRSGAVIAGAIDASGNFVNQLISNTLNTQTKQILGEFIFTGSGALAIKTDANNGIWISPTGILAKKAGATTFALDTAGNATFAGSLVGASGTFGMITAGTLTGCTFQTATSGYRTVINSSNILFYSSANQVGFIRPDATSSMVIGSSDEIWMTDLAGVPNFKFSSLGRIFLMTAGAYINFASGRRLTDNSSYIGCDGGFVTTGDIQTGGTFKSSDGTSGLNHSGWGYISSLRWNGGTLEAKISVQVMKDGLVTGITQGNWYAV